MLIASSKLVNIHSLAGQKGHCLTKMAEGGKCVCVYTCTCIWNILALLMVSIVHCTVDHM